MLNILVLLKSYRQAKKRLAEQLNEQQRAELTRAMFLDVLAELETLEARVFVLSSCQQVRKDLEDSSALYIEEPAGLASMNEAAAYGEQFIAGRSEPDKDRLLVLHADLPLLKASDITAMLHAGSDYVIASDDLGDGTNAFLKPFDAMAYQYGKGSRDKHIKVLKSRAKDIQLTHRDSLQWDVDTINDLSHCRLLLDSRLPYYGPARNFRRFLAGEEISSLLNSVDLLDNRQAFERFCESLPEEDVLLGTAAKLRDQGFADLVSFSPKVFLPLTHLCRDVCHYCTFTKTPGQLEQLYMSEQQVLELALEAEKQGCYEALLTLGEKPELRFPAAKAALDEMGFGSTLEYVAHIARRITEETALLPHINAGNMTADEIAMLRPVSASMGIMLESVSRRLCEKGMPHYGSPDKLPEARLRTLELAGEMQVPFTTGILIGIGETRRERLESLWAIYELQQRYGHIQEVIIQNFRAKTDTLMAASPEPNLNELLWTIAAARLMFGPEMSIQAPPNLSPGELQQLVGAGINDWGGVSPLTPDHVNPEAPWPHIERLANETAQAGKQLVPRLTIYPKYIHDMQQWISPQLQGRVMSLVDAAGLPREDNWLTGSSSALPAWQQQGADVSVSLPDKGLVSVIGKALQGHDLEESEIVQLLQARGAGFDYVCRAADQLRQQQCGDEVAYVVNRNINYTNVCYFKCRFCAFSKGKTSEELRGKPYDLSEDEIRRRVDEAWQRGATEVCMQGGIHPDYTGETYKQIVAWVKDQQPEMHVHAFSPLEIWQGAKTTGMSLDVYLDQLKQLGLGTLPGTAAEILDDDVRAVICPDKINSLQWLEVMAAAHRQGIRTTATMMFGHVEQYEHQARHMIRIRELQKQTGGFTEFVPLPFVAAESPVYLRGKARQGPTFRESVLVHAVARLVLGQWLKNIQASWVKMGEAGAQFCLQAGANDLGGTLMNESITRAAGASHGQEMSPERLESLIVATGRVPRQRTTLYQDAPRGQLEKSFGAEELLLVENTPLNPSGKKRDFA